jgi:toxin ParE1/3/4
MKAVRVREGFVPASGSDDLLRQFRYYLLALGVPEIAVRFRDSVRRTVRWLRQHPLVGPQYRLSNPQLQSLRSWPVAGFEAIRIYYLVNEDSIRIVRILHGKRDVRRVLEREGLFDTETGKL